jgi:hypothetical protein
MTKIKDLSIADLKAAYDFVRMDLKDLEEKAKEENISPSKIGAYNEVRKVEFDLYNRLLNVTRDLE